MTKFLSYYFNVMLYIVTKETNINLREFGMNSKYYHVTIMQFCALYFFSIYGCPKLWQICQRYCWKFICICLKNISFSVTSVFVWEFTCICLKCKHVGVIVRIGSLSATITIWHFVIFLRMSASGMNKSETLDLAANKSFWSQIIINMSLLRVTKMK